jgi:hypothetical protein
MNKYVFVVPFLVLFFSCAAETENGRLPVIYSTDAEELGDEIRIENDRLELRFLPQTAEIILTEKGTGVVWRSNPEGGAGDTGADEVTRYLLQSQFSLVYEDNAGMGVTLSSAEYAVAKGMYEYALVDGGIEVNYTVGNIPRIYLFPAALPEERMMALMEKMEPSERSRVEASFRRYDLDNLRPVDNKNALLDLYPDLEDGPLYILRDTVQEFMKVQLEEFFFSVGYTREDFARDSARYRQADMEKPFFNVSLRYELDGNSLLVSAALDNIKFRPAYPLTQLNILPFFGAAGTADDGYIFVPDGSGALIYFNNGKQNQIAYNNYVYGWDAGLYREAIVSDNKAPYPVFGLWKNGSALMCVIEEGASYAAVRADVSGRNCSYNSVSAQFAVVHGAAMDIESKSDKAVYLYEKEPPPGERILLRFMPCTGEGYIGMAKEYRAYLRERYPDAFKGTGPEVPVAVEIVGAVNKTQHRLGIPFDLPLKLTSYREAELMNSHFASLGWKNLRIKMIGWFNGSVDHSVPSSVNLISELGSKNDFMNLAAAVRKNGYTFYAEGDFLYMRDNTVFDGFNLNADAARYVSFERMESYPYSFVWFGEREWGKLSYVARPAYMGRLIENYVKRIDTLGVSAAAFRTIGSTLAGDYNERRRVSRETSMKMQQSLLNDLKEKGKGIWVAAGYVYTVPYADFVADINLTDQGFGITDVSVPFYQIVLHGLVPYAGRAINLAEDYTKNLLVTIERGGGLYFSFMMEETALLQETKFRQFYANEYRKWVGDADALYRRFAKDFEGLWDQTIEDHKMLTRGVTVTEYTDGTQVVVNMGKTAYTYEGVRIGPDDYAVIR